MALAACRYCGGVDIAADDDMHDVILESITVDAPAAMDAG
jgi:hypothetical protein